MESRDCFRRDCYSYEDGILNEFEHSDKQEAEAFFFFFKERRTLIMKATDENTLGCTREDQQNPERVRIESIFLPMAS